MEYVDKIKPIAQDDFEVLCSRNILAECSLIPSKKLLYIERLYGGRARLSAGSQDSGGYYEDVWEFPCKEYAMLALITWDPDKADEPTRWDRHPDSGRYRMNGRADREYIRPRETSDYSRICHSIYATYREARIIVSIDEDSDHIGSEMPEGSRCFHVLSHRTTCTHTPPCDRLDRIYCCSDHFVVIHAEDLQKTTLGSVIERLIS